MSRSPTPLQRLALLIASLIVITLAIVLLAAVLPWLSEITHLEKLVELYRTFVRKALFKGVFGTDIEPPWTHVALDMGLLWLSLFVVVNAFVYRNEGILLWGHIRKNYCSRTAASLLGSGLCTFTRFLLAFIATPYAVARIFLHSFRSHGTLFSSCFITLDPTEIATYLKYVGLALATLIAGAAAASKVMLVGG